MMRTNFSKAHFRDTYDQISVSELSLYKPNIQITHGVWIIKLWKTAPKTCVICSTQDIENQILITLGWINLLNFLNVPAGSFLYK
jgi:hypothetical protein